MAPSPANVQNAALVAACADHNAAQRHAEIMARLDTIERQMARRPAPNGGAR